MKVGVDVEREKRAELAALNAAKAAGAHEMATSMRRGAENRYREELATASRWELFANLLEQGYTVEEAQRRSFKSRLDQ